MNLIIRSFFFFSKRERIGVLALLTCMVSALLAPSVFAYFRKEKAPHFTAFEEALALLESGKEAENNLSSSQAGTAFTDTDRINEAQLFLFDPNTLSVDSLQLLGLSPKLAKTIANYRNKGGKFYQSEDFKKMYGLSEGQYLQLKPYIHITAFGKIKPMYASNHDASGNHPEQAMLLALFDPNLATAEELEHLGLSEKIAANIVKFRSKGGQFRKKEDFQKIYGISATQYQQLEPYIQITKQEFVAHNHIPTNYDNSQHRVNVKKNIRIDINQATPEEWQSIRGIGPYYAKNITYYRDKLGGFVSVAQVAETKGLPDSTFQKIQSSLVASPLLRKIPINSCDAKTLSAHPYINGNLANILIAYRNQHGAFKNLESLKGVAVLDEELIEKIGPYLSFD